MNEYELMIERKEKEFSIIRERDLAQETDSLKRMTAQEIMKERKHVEEIEHRLKNAEINYQRNLDNLEKNVRTKIRSFTEKWHQEM